MRRQAAGLSFLWMLCLIASSGCGLLKEVGTGIANRVIDSQVAKIAPTLKAKYNITAEDDWKSAVKKMADVEGKDNPELMTKLLKVGPEAWEIISNDTLSFTDKISAGTKIIAELKDSDGNQKIIGGTTGTVLFSMLLFFIQRYRKQKAATKDVITSVQNPNADKDGGTKGAVRDKNNTLVNNMVTEMFPNRGEAA